MKKISFSVLLAILLLFTVCVGCSQKQQQNTATANGINSQLKGTISFTDDDGRKINLSKPCEKIISLYSAHTENLYTLGAGDKIIGVQNTSNYPPDAAKKDIFDYDSDPEKLIAKSPDLVLIRPFITRKSPNFVKALENAGITVVSLYPEKLSDFDDYINKLAMLTGTQVMAQKQLNAFHSELDKISALTKNTAVKKKVFFESTEVNLRTVASDSMAASAISLAGGENIAKDAKPVEKGSSIATFGIEKVLSLANDIDVYVSQSGSMNAGGDVHSITVRPGFNAMKAVKEGKVFVINEKIISSPTFRYSRGVKELARYLYPEQFDQTRAYVSDQPATKRDLANIIVKSEHMPVYVLSSSNYYQQKHKGHTYGMYSDVPWTDRDFDVIETVVQAGYLEGEKDAGTNQEYFKPDRPVTKYELAKAIFVMSDFKIKDQHAEIKDLSECDNQNIVQTLVDNHIFELTGGEFEPNQTVSAKQIVDAFSNMKSAK